METNTMVHEIPILFLGGSTRSGKSIIGNRLEKKLLVGVQRIKFSEMLKRHLTDPRNKKLPDEDPLSSGVVYVDWKSQAESEATKDLCKEIKSRRQKDAEGFKLLIVDTHFATFSPGGYMMGIDPTGLRAICDCCNLLGEKSQKKVVIGLVNIGLGDVLQVLEGNWTKTNLTAFPSASAIMPDLEMNRLYAMAYYNVIASLVGPSRILFHRTFVNFNDARNAAFEDGNRRLHEAAEEMARFLDREQIVQIAVE